MKTKTSVMGLLGLLLLILVACGAGGNGGNKGGEPESLSGGFTWRRVGGIAGFCDVVTVSVSGSASVASCRSEPPEVRAEVKLTSVQTDRVRVWVARLGSFQHEESDPATADALTIAIDFAGLGEGEPADADYQAIEDLASEVLRAASQP